MKSLDKNNYFHWGNELKTGLKVIDNQHRGLINTINDILQLCFQKETIDLNSIKNIYEMLNTYIHEHFGTEKKIMKYYNIDARHTDLHYELHTEFNNDVAKYFSDLSVLESKEKLGEIVQFLIRWLAYHILNMDKSLVRQIDFIKNDKMSPSDAYEKEQNLFNDSAEPLLKALRALFYVISDKNKELVKSNNELEEKVKTRTLDLQRAFEKLELISIRDELTGLYNRRYAIAHLEQSLGEWRRYHTVFSILFIDVDKFKSVNDNFGHEYGDKVLKWLSTFLQQTTRLTDIVCRLGGDEFLVICDHCSSEDAVRFANKLIIECSERINNEIIQVWTPSLSIGIAEINESCPSVSELINSADNAMYIAKNNGGNSFKLASS